MAVARGIQGLAPLFKRHQQLIKSIDNESKRTIESLRHITRRLRSLRRGKPISTVERLIAQFEWTRESKKTVPSLFQNMEVLERSMRTTATLVNIQLLSQTYQQDPSDAVLAQFELSRKMLRIEFDKLQHAQQVQKRLMMQQQISPSQHVKAEEFAQEIITILKREIPQLKNHQPAGSQSTSDSRSPPTSHISDEPSPITTPSLSLPSRSESQSVIKPEQDGDVPGPKRQISRKRRTRSAPSIKEAHICGCPLLDHQDWSLSRLLDDPRLIVQMHPAIHPISNEKGMVVALIQLEDGGTPVRYLNMEMEVR
ncbi:predicted protein [Aspergillus terreus NIH2624]|uniref:Uncharacterized protein n=1 Tax=Aspergillus terreus (strain NIH 2624 / FGSC A1156) TaxID=341663 RepID=Q0CK92_ASPTN|nr:uncharacterized protein ATEG_05892 [Aspergillus terreus NIH2624]EAU33653.1 predicted protein [Aspergillus terreus NIH2624]